MIMSQVKANSDDISLLKADYSNIKTDMLTLSEKNYDVDSYSPA